MHRSPSWIAWWCLYAVAARILIVWLYNNTGQSVFAVALFHATLNLSYMLFPVNGSHFDMELGGPVMALTAAIVTVVWGPGTSMRTLEALLLMANLLALCSQTASSPANWTCSASAHSGSRWAASLSVRPADPPDRSPAHLSLHPEADSSASGAVFRPFAAVFGVPSGRKNTTLLMWRFLSP